MYGRYRFKKKKSNGTVEVSDWYHNLIVDGENTGVNLVRKALLPGSSSTIAISSAEIGTGQTAPTDADTDLETPITVGIPVATQEIVGDEIVINFFIASSELENGTYHEFALRIGANLFARSIISPSFTKEENQDTTVEYIIGITNDLES